MVNARGVGWLAMNTVATAVNLQGPTLLVDAETKVWIWLGEFSTMFSLFLGGALQMFQTWKMAFRLGWKDGSEPRICVQDWKPYFGLVPSSLCFGKEGMIFELLRVRLSKLVLNSKRNLHHRNWKANESCFGRLSFQTFFPFAQCISKTYTLSTDPWYPPTDWRVEIGPLKVDKTSRQEKKVRRGCFWAWICWRWCFTDSTMRFIAIFHHRFV